MRHATDPDHLTARNSSNRQRGDDRSARSSSPARLRSGGLGHATTAVRLRAADRLSSLLYLPEAHPAWSRGPAVGLMIVCARSPAAPALGRRGTIHAHDHPDVRTPLGRLRHRPRARNGRFRAGVGLLLLAGMQSRVIAVTSLAVPGAVSQLCQCRSFRLGGGTRFGPRVRQGPRLDRITPDARPGQPGIRRLVTHLGALTTHSLRVPNRKSL